MSEYARINTSQFPTVIITFTGNIASDESFDRYLEEMKSVYDSGKKIAMVFDARQAVLPSLGHQRKQAAWLKKHDELLKKFCMGTAYVITKKPVRMMLRMIFTITPQPVPYKVHGKMKEAEEWAQSQLTA